MKLLPAFTGVPEHNRVYNCRAEDMLTALADSSIDLIVTSPPYDNLRTYNGFTWEFEYIARQSYRVLKQGGVLVWVVGDATIDGSETLTSFKQALYFKETCGFNLWQTSVYEKDGMPYPPQKKYYNTFEYMFTLSKGEVKTFNGLREKNLSAGRSLKATHRQDNGSTKQSKTIEVAKDRLLTNVWRISTGYMRTTTDIDAYEHPAMFPEALAERHILTWSNPGDVVLDYFGGSGTTAKMARKNGRDFITNDISREYCDLMERRLALPFTPSFLPMLETA